MAAYKTQFPSGVAGDIVASDETTVEAIILDQVAGVYPQAWGAPLRPLTTSGQTKFVQFVSGSVATDFKGVLVRQVPSVSGNFLQGFNDGVPNPAQIQGLCTKGYVNVLCTQGTPVREGIVYIRVVAASGKFIGDFEAASDGANNVALSTTQAVWATDGKDSGNVAVLRVFK